MHSKTCGCTQEAVGYALKDMPEKTFPDGTMHPRAEQGKYHARPKVFYWHGNISDERAEECIDEYRKNNQQTGGPNFHKSGFTFGGGDGHAETHMILEKNLMTWPITHARRHGWLRLVDSFLKLLCLMFEDGGYELGLEIINRRGGGSGRRRAWTRSPSSTSTRASRAQRI